MIVNNICLFRAVYKVKQEEGRVSTETSKPGEIPGYIKLGNNIYKSNKPHVEHRAWWHYLAKLTALVSLMTVILICPG